MLSKRIPSIGLLIVSEMAWKSNGEVCSIFVLCDPVYVNFVRERAIVPDHVTCPTVLCNFCVTFPELVLRLECFTWNLNALYCMITSIAHGEMTGLRWTRLYLFTLLFLLNKWCSFTENWQCLLWMIWSWKWSCDVLYGRSRPRNGLNIHFQIAYKFMDWIESVFVVLYYI